MDIKVKKLDKNAYLPRYMSLGAAGMDLASVENLTLLGGQRALVSTGLAFELPEGIEIQIRPRSGLAIKHGITVLNAPGTIDSDYRGLVKIVLFNTTHEAFEVKIGDRIAQAVFSKYEVAELVEGDLNETERGSGGFGSTNV
jgi:dUTP pyrophosphatase